MKYKLLGRSGLRVSELCLGCATFGTNWGTIGSNKPESGRIFDAFVEAGGNFIDTSNRYQESQSEEFLGTFIQGDRDRYVLATKYSLLRRLRRRPRSQRTRQPPQEPAAARSKGA